MGYLKHLLPAVAALVAVIGLAGVPANATPTFQAGVCPDVSGHAAVYPGNIGSATDCNLEIFFNSDGSIDTVNGPQTTYESIEDALIGVINNSGKTINSFNISGTGTGTFGIFGFETDGIDYYANVTPNAMDVAHPVNGHYGYGGPNGYFTNVNGALNSGTVNFDGGIASGATNYFSLERPIDVSAPPTVGAPNQVPEPATLAVFGLGILGLGIARRRKSA